MASRLIPVRFGPLRFALSRLARAPRFRLFRLAPARSTLARFAAAGLGSVLVGLALGLAPAPGGVQAQDLGSVVSPILTLDREKLFAGTLYGQRVNRELAAASAAMAAETRDIEAKLEEEERGLTEKRATMEPDAFRELATAFDEKVQSLRDERKAAEADLRGQIEAAQTEFFRRIGPVLGRLVRERGAVLIVDTRAILLSAADVDITNAAIARIDAVLGDGGDLETLPEASDAAPNAPAAPGVPAAPSAEPGAGLDIIPAPDDAAPADQ